MPQMVDDIFDLADGLKLNKFILGGGRWAALLHNRP